MATFFWFNGTGTWDNASTANWGTSTNGGGAPAGPPTAADTAVFDANSGAGTVSIAATAAALVVTAGRALTYNATGGPTFGAVTVTAGSWITGAFTHTYTSFSSTSGTRTLTLDNSTINITGTSGTPWNVSTAGTLTLSVTSTTINYTGGAAGVTTTFTAGGGSIWSGATVVFTAAGTIQLTSGPTFKSFSSTSTTNKLDSLLLTGNLTIAASGSLVLAGNSTVNRAFVRSSTLGTQLTVSVPSTATVTLTNVDFQDIASAGTFGTWTGTSLGDCLGNSGITFDPSVSLTWDTSKTGAQNWSGSNWLGTTNRVPLPQDDVVLPAIGSATTITMDMPRIGRNQDWSAFNRTMAAGSAYTVFGNQILGASNTIAAVTTTLAGRGAQTITSNGKAFNNTININAFGGSYTLQDNLSTPSGIQVNNGTFAGGPFDLTALSLGSSSTPTRAISGSGTWSFTGTSGTLWNASGSGLTTTAFTGTIKFTGNVTTTITFAGNGLTYPNFWWSSTTATGTLIIAGANTFNDFKINRTTARTIQFPAGPQTITSWTDESLGTAILTLNGGGSSAVLTKASGVVSTDYLNVINIDAPAVPDASLWFAGAHSTNVSGTRFRFLPPAAFFGGGSLLLRGVGS